MSIRGKLVWQATKQGKERRVIHPTKKGMSLPTTFAPDQLEKSLHEAKEDAIDVDLDLDNGKPVRVRRAGEEWAMPAAPVIAGNQPAGDFHNPYNFIPAPPPVTDKNFALGHRAPAGHDRYHKELWSGHIDIRIETVSPLLLPDAARASTHDKHKTFPVRLDENGKPNLAPTSLKGALRSAYEAVTNSRFGVFHGHDEPLAWRMDPGEGLAMVPARVVHSSQLELLLGTNVPTSGAPLRNYLPKWNTGTKRWDVPGRMMYAAWFRRYDRAGYSNSGPAFSPTELKYMSGARPNHNDHVACIIEEVEKRSAAGNKIFSYWSVVAMVPASAAGTLPAKSAWGTLPRPNLGHSHVRMGPSTLRTITGYVCITNQNFGRKHDERVFFSDASTPITVPMGSDWLGRWKEVVADYQNIQTTKAELDRRRRSTPPVPADAYLGRDPNKTAFSRHISDPRAATLQPGDLCYARVSRTGTVVDLYPVMIARDRARKSPADLLLNNPELQPARSLSELSPADRVFGWVNQSGDGAWRGQLRIGAVRCREATVSEGDESLPLAILSAPKPQQARFYLAADHRGRPPKNKEHKNDVFYLAAMGLRGRKVYPHHERRAGAPPPPADDPYWSWTHAQTAASDVAHWSAGKLDYARPPQTDDSQRNDQNRSIEGWVNPGSVFATRIDVTNLDAAELGALLWLLDLPKDHFHRLGGGKPLGFGSVRISIEAADLATGEAIARRYISLLPRTEATNDELSDGRPQAIRTEAVPENDPAPQKPWQFLVEAFKSAAKDGYKAQSFENVSFIAAFLQAARGFSDYKPTHYPRVSGSPDAEGKSYAWFVSNEATGPNAPPDNKRSLGPLAGDPGLPYW